MFAVERHGRLPEGLCVFVLCAVCHRCLLYLARIVHSFVVRYRVRYRERLCVSCLRSPPLSTEVRQENVSIACTRAQIDACIAHTSRNGWVCAEHGRRRSRTAAENVSGLDVNQSLSHPS